MKAPEGRLRIYEKNTNLWILRFVDFEKFDFENPRAREKYVREIHECAILLDSKDPRGVYTCISIFIYAYILRIHIYN